MKKDDFLNELSEVLEVDSLKEDSPLSLDSLNVLSIIAFVDEKFDKQLKAADLKNIKSVADLTSLIQVNF